MEMFMIYIVGLYKGLQPTEKRIRVPLISQIERTGSIEAIAKDMANIVQQDVRVRRMLILDPKGEKHYFKMRDIPDRDGYKSGNWEWVEFNSQLTYLMVQDPIPCGRCGGNGVVSWGRVNHILWHGIPVRGCFECGTAGFVLE